MKFYTFLKLFIWAFALIAMEILFWEFKLSIIPSLSLAIFLVSAATGLGFIFVGLPKNKSIVLILCNFFFKHKSARCCKMSTGFLVCLTNPSNYFFPESATKAMVSIIAFHHDVMFYLTFSTVFIFWMLASTIVFFSDFLEEEKIEAISSRTTYEKILEIVWTLVPMITLVFISLWPLTLCMERPVEPRLFIPNIFNIYSENLDKIKEENMNKYKAYMERRDFEIARDKWILLELLEEAKSSFVNKVCEEEIQSAADVNALFGKPHKFIVITLQETLNREKNVCVEKAGEAFKACEFLKDLVRNECIGTVNPWTGKVANSSFITEEMLDRFMEWLDCEEEVQTQPPIELSLLMPRVYAIDVNKKYLYELLKEARNVYVSFECGSKREYIEQLYAKIRKNNPQWQAQGHPTKAELVEEMAKPEKAQELSEFVSNRDSALHEETQCRIRAEKEFSSCHYLEYLNHVTKDNQEVFIDKETGEVVDVPVRIQDSLRSLRKFSRCPRFRTE